MRIAISVYQARRGKRSSVSPVCPGVFGWTTVSTDPAKARERCLERLRRATPKLSPVEFSRLFVPPGRRLERVRLELTLRSDDDKKNVAGIFPLVVEPRPAGAGRELWIGYHPLKPAAWFEVDENSDLAAQTRPFYARIFTPDDDFERLKWERSDTLSTLRFDAPAPSLLDTLPKPDDTRELAGAGIDVRLHDLLSVATNQTARAADGRLRPGFLRESLRQRMQQLLCGAQKSPVLVVGPPGSGKSTVIAQSVLDLLDADDYPAHRNLDRVHKVLSLRGRHIIAGMSYVGQWEARCMALFAHAKKQRLILWCDDVHAWGSIGKTTVSDRTLADFFRGPLSRRELIVIGECTQSELTLLEHEAPALADAFVRVHVEPASAEQTLGIMLHEGRHLERELEVEFDPRSFRTIVDLSASLFTGSAFPGKALGPLRALANAARVVEDGRHDITPGDVVRYFSRQTGLPEILVARDAPLSRATLRRELGQQIVGQDVALDAACDLVLSIRAGACAGGRPYGVFLFTGPTGTGKTELAKCIAEYLYGNSARLVRFDMGELSTADAVSRLIGDRAEPQGRLTDAIRAQPFCVLLLDEIEKAHPAVLNLMLQIFDDGRLTDARAQVADFTHSVIIMTSNLGSGRRVVRGLTADPDALTAEVATAVREFFPPELFNRIDRVVPFRPLSLDAAKRIAAKELAQLAARPGLAERNVFLKFTDAVVGRVVEAGYSADYGARSLKRHIDRAVGDLLTHTAFAERAAEMRLLWLHCSEKGLAVHTEVLREAEPLGDSFVEALLAENPAALRQRVPTALATLRRMESGGQLPRLSREITRELEGFRLGEGERADQVFHLDALRAHVRALERRLETQIARDAELQALDRQRKRAEGEALVADDYTALGQALHKRRNAGRRRDVNTRGARLPRLERGLLADLCEVVFLERMLERSEELNQHVVLMDVLRLAAHHERRRFSQGNPGLLEWLVGAYSRARGRLETAAVALADGTLHEVASVDGLHDLLEQRPRQVALRLVGPGVADFFASEAGAHVRRAAGAGPEIVRVAASRTGLHPLHYLQAHADKRRAFEAALEGEGPLPENPDQLLPVARNVRFDPEPGRATLALIEDYRFAYVATRRVRKLDELLRDFWLLGAGRGSDRLRPGEPT